MSDSPMMDTSYSLLGLLVLLGSVDTLRSQGAVLLKNHHEPLGRRARWCNPGERCSLWAKPHAQQDGASSSIVARTARPTD